MKESCSDNGHGLGLRAMVAAVASMCRVSPVGNMTWLRGACTYLIIRDWTRDRQYVDPGKFSGLRLGSEWLWKQHSDDRSIGINSDNCSVISQAMNEIERDAP